MNEKSGRGPMLAAGSLIALGAGLMVYRWIILGWTWHGGRSSVLLALSVGALVGGGQLVRAFKQRPDQPVWWLRVLVGVPSLAAGMAIGYAIAPTLGHVPLHEREVEGVTIALPDGDEKADRGELVGKVFIGNAGGFEGGVGVTWQPGEADAITMKATVEALSEGLGGSASVVDHDDFAVGDGIAHRSARMSKDGTPGWMTLFACGPRFFAVFTIGDGGEGLHRRVLASVRCHAGANDAIAAVPAIVPLPAGWTSAPSDPGQLMFVHGDAGLVIREVETIDDADVARVMGVIGHAMGGAITLGAKRTETGPEGARSVWSGSITVEQQPMDAVVSMWPCADRGGGLMAMYLHPSGTDEQPGLDLMLRTRCTGKGERTPDYGTTR